MATVQVCDVCGQPAERLPFTVTENGDGRKWEACSAKCLLDGPPPA